MTLPDLVFVEEWPENTPIAWWNAGREKLNVVIRQYNALEHAYGVDGEYTDMHSVRELLVAIEEAHQTGATIDGGSSWLQELVDIERRVIGRLDNEWQHELSIVARRAANHPDDGHPG